MRSHQPCKTESLLGRPWGWRCGWTSAQHGAFSIITSGLSQGGGKVNDIPIHPSTQVGGCKENVRQTDKFKPLMTGKDVVNIFITLTFSQSAP